MKQPQSAKVLVGLVAACALAVLGFGLFRWESADLVRFTCFVILSAAASRMKLSLPGLNGNMPMNVPFMLLASLGTSSTSEEHHVQFAAQLLGDLKK